MHDNLKQLTNAIGEAINELHIKTRAALAAKPPRLAEFEKIQEELKPLLELQEAVLVAAVDEVVRLTEKHKELLDQFLKKK